MRYKNILIIDDDEDDQEIFLKAVAQISTSVSCLALSDASNALKKLVAKEITPDVIFLDLNMPIMNGQQFLSAIKENEALKTIPVIILSTSSQVSTIQLTKELGAFAFITKPNKYSELIEILTPLIDFKSQPS